MKLGPNQRKIGHIGYVFFQPVSWFGTGNIICGNSKVCINSLLAQSVIGLTQLFTYLVTDNLCYTYFSLFTFCKMTDLAHFGVGSLTPKFELGQDFCTVHLPTKFHHFIFNYLEVMLTNKQTCKQTEILSICPPHLAMQCRWRMM